MGEETPLCEAIKPVFQHFTIDRVYFGCVVEAVMVHVDGCKHLGYVFAYLVAFLTAPAHLSYPFGF